MHWRFIHFLCENVHITNIFLTFVISEIMALFRITFHHQGYQSCSNSVLQHVHIVDISYVKMCHKPKITILS